MAEGTAVTAVIVGGINALKFYDSDKIRSFILKIMEQKLSEARNYG